MRELIVDFNQEDPLSSGTEAGYIGENNATELVIKPSSKLLHSGSSFFTVVFLTKGQIYRTEQLDPASEFRITLEAHLTQDHYLSLQLEGYSEENTLLCKSPMVTKIHFMPSIQGNESEFTAEEYQAYVQVALNTNSRHQHHNSTVLSHLGEENGVLTYKDSPIIAQSQNIKTAVLSYENGDFDTSFSSSGLTRIDFFSYESLDSFVIPQDGEIVSVELQIDSEDCPEWLDLKNMTDYDPNNPCIYYIHKTSTDPSLQSTVFCRLYFLSGVNKFANYISAFLLKKIRISYVENQVS